MATEEAVTGPINLGNPDEIHHERPRRQDRRAGRLQVGNHPSAAARWTIRAGAGPTSSRARAILGWEPKVTLDQGLETTIGYFREMVSRR